MGHVAELPDTTRESADPAGVLRFMLSCFATGDLRHVPEVVSPLYYDHQSAGRARPHGPELFCSVVRAARKSLLRLDIEIVAVRAIGADQAESRARWHWTDESGLRRVRATVDRIRVQHGQVVEHWGRELSARATRGVSR